jgi:hypothetical protein
MFSWPGMMAGPPPGYAPGMVWGLPMPNVVTAPGIVPAAPATPHAAPAAPAMP